MHSKVLKTFGGVDDARFLTEIKKDRPYFALLAEKATESVDSIFHSAVASKRDRRIQTGAAKPRVSYYHARAYHTLNTTINTTNATDTTIK